jgi:integrase
MRLSSASLIPAAQRHRKLLTLYGQWLEESTPQPGTILLYRRILGTVPPDALWVEAKATEFKGLLRARYSPMTAYKWLSCIHRFARFASERGFADWRAADRLRPGRPPRKQLPELVSEAVIRQASDLAGSRRSSWAGWTPLHRTALLWLHLHTGLRASEGLFLTAGEVDFDGATISLKDTPQRRLKTNNASRTIPMTGMVQTLLAEIAEGKQPHERLFTGKRPFLFSWISKKIGAPVMPNTMRHTVATALIQSRLPAPAVAAWLGHSTILTTQMHYLNLRPVRIPGLEPEMWESFAVERMGFTRGG